MSYTYVWYIDTQDKVKKAKLLQIEYNSFNKKRFWIKPKFAKMTSVESVYFSSNQVSSAKTINETFNLIDKNIECEKKYIYNALKRTWELSINKNNVSTKDCLTDDKIDVILNDQSLLLYDLGFGKKI